MILNPDLNAESLKIPKPIYLRILGKAVSQTTTDIKDLEAALPFADFDKIQSISHRLKGDYDNMRISTLSKLARELNMEVKNGRDKEKMMQYLMLFKEAFFQLETELAECLKA
ncbi:MAG: Hpt domain-containing protein [Candidatus Omnitrophica bacterium]|nr:Hpt domain-containing protein [Candidatus Omnitrophota bacterium]